ncbi:MAG TPA: ATP-binding protein [Pseudonocardiaceae bacterium]|jgi:hypothetical protein
MDDLVLVALPTAVTCTELFVQFALSEWSLLEMQGEVKQVARELVNAAVANNDPRAPRFMTVRLSLAGGNLTIEVEDGDINWRELPLPGGLSAEAVQLPRRSRQRRAAAPESPVNESSSDVDPDVIARVFAALSRSAEPE